VHAKAPTVENAPREQLVQAAAALAPSDGLNFPAGHKLQLLMADAPLMSLKVPAAHATGATDPIGQKYLFNENIGKSETNHNGFGVIATCHTHEDRLSIDW
jgi:hypothetical protein